MVLGRTPRKQSQIIKDDLHGSLIVGAKRERHVAKARPRDAKRLVDCGSVIKDTPRQDVLPHLETGLLSQVRSSERCTLFPQPRLQDGTLTDSRFGCGWRLVVGDALQAPAGLTAVAVIALAASQGREAEGRGRRMDAAARVPRGAAATRPLCLWHGHDINRSRSAAGRTPCGAGLNKAGI